MVSRVLVSECLSFGKNFSAKKCSQNPDESLKIEKQPIVHPHLSSGRNMCPRWFLAYLFASLQVSGRTEKCSWNPNEYLKIKELPITHPHPSCRASYTYFESFWVSEKIIEVKSIRKTTILYDRFSYTSRVSEFRKKNFRCNPTEPLKIGILRRRIGLVKVSHGPRSPKYVRIHDQGAVDWLNRTSLVRANSSHNDFLRICTY